MADRTLHFSAKGFKTQMIAIAPEIKAPNSKRHSSIDKEVSASSLHLNCVEREIFFSS